MGYSWSKHGMRFLLGLVRNAGALFHDVFITVAPHSISPPSWSLLCASSVPMLALKHTYFHPTFILGWMTAACKLMMMIQLYNVMLTYCFGRFCTMFFGGAERSIMVRGGWSFLLLGGIIIYSLSKQSPLHIMWLENYMRSWSMLIVGASIFEYLTSWTQVPFPL